MATKQSFGRSKSQREFDLLAEKVQSWALISGVSDSTRTRDLIDDLRERNNWSYWASCRPEEILPEVPLKRSASMKLWYRRIVFFRNLMVFLPVTITWIAISEASSAFSEYINANPGTLINFLQFWQDGYGFLPSVWRLSNVALIDFLILSVIMLLTIAVQMISSRSEKIEIEERKEFSLERNSLSRELYEFFQRNQTVTPLTANKALATALRDLGKSTQNLERLTKDLSKSVKGFPSYLAVIREVKSLGGAVRKLRQSGNGSNSSI